MNELQDLSQLGKIAYRIGAMKYSEDTGYNVRVWHPFVVLGFPLALVYVFITGGVNACKEWLA